MHTGVQQLSDLKVCRLSECQQYKQKLAEARESVSALDAKLRQVLLSVQLTMQ